MSEIVEAEGLDGVGRLLPTVNAWGSVGRHLGLTQQAADYETLVTALVTKVATSSEPHWLGCLQGVQQALEPSERAELLKVLGARLEAAEALMLFKSAPFEAATWDAVRAVRPAVELAYWREVTPWGWGHSESDLSTIIDRLLDVDRPISAFNAAAHDFDKVEGAMLARLMKALIQPTAEVEADVQLDASQIDDALDALEASGAASVAELAQLEYVFIKGLKHTRHGIRNLEKQIEQSPSDFVHLVSLIYKRDDGSDDPAGDNLAQRADERVFENVYSVLNEMRRTPGTRDDGSVDGSKLIAWLVDVRERFRAVGRVGVGDSQIGQLLGRCRTGSDGIWPNEAVRDALESSGSERMLRGMEIGLFNNRGATWRGPGGSQERTLAGQHRGYGRKLQAEFPMTARLLESIARMWDDHADWHDTDEAVRKRLRR